MIKKIRNFTAYGQIDEETQKEFVEKIRRKMINTLFKGDLGAITIMGPATIVKEMKRNPKKIELLLNK